MTQASRRLPPARRPLTPGELKLLRVAARQAARNYLAERKAAQPQGEQGHTVAVCHRSIA